MMKLENRDLIELLVVVLFLAIIILGATVKHLSSDVKPLVAKDSLTLELEQTKVEYEKWTKDQAKRDSITRMKVEMGEVEESFEDYRSRIRREINRF